MEIPMLTAKAKCKLDTIVMRFDKLVNEYYYWLFDVMTLSKDSICSTKY